MTSQIQSSTPSFFERATGKPVNPLWLLRLFPTAALICLALALGVWKSGPWHSFCIGLAAGLLIGLVAQTFAVSHVELKQAPQPSDVDQLSIAR